MAPTDDASDGQLTNSMACLSTQPNSTRRNVVTTDIIRTISIEGLAVSSDGSQLLFTRDSLTEAGDRREDTLWLLDVRQKTRKPFHPDQDISSPAWSPVDSSLAALLSKDDAAQIHLFSDAAADSKVLTTLPDGVDEFLWSPLGDKIALLSVSPLDEESRLSRYYGGSTFSLWALVASDGSQEKIRTLAVPGSDDGFGSAPTLLPSPDDTRVAFSVGNPSVHAEFAQDEIYVMDLASGATEMVTADYDREVGGDGFRWLDDDRIVAIDSDRGNAGLVQINVHDRTVTPWWSGQRVVESFVYATKGKHLLAVASDPVTPPEIYMINDGQEAVAVTEINAFLPRELILAKPEQVQYQGPSGDTIHGYLHKPPGFDESQTYPMITLAHGGPYSWWSSAYNHNCEHQAIAAGGYLVFCPNPRGSMSYGQAFAGALADKWPGPEFDDVMAGIDHLVKRPYVDASKLGISGASAGGVLTDWAMGHTKRFGAAVSVSDIADMNAYWFLGDQPELGAPDKEPWLDPKDKALSPLTYGINVKSPTLFISGTRDVRTPAAVGGEKMFRLLKHLRVPTAFIEFENAGHSIGRSCDARHPGLAVHYLLRWMDLHLRGQAAPEFDVRAVR